jgi:hypothetical protein
VNPLALGGEGIVQHIVTGRGNGEDVVILVDAKLLDVDIGILPCLH